MNYNQLLEQTKQELFGGWKPFEAVWLLIFIAAQIGIYIYNPDSILGMVSGISGIICNVFVSKGKISNYFFGLIFAYTYFYISLGANFLGEMNTTLYVYIPAQFIGSFLFVQLLNHFGGSSTGLDGLSTIIVIAAQALMVLRYREQWLLWILLNIISIALWAENTSMYVMYSAYLLNSLYGYYNWSKLQKAQA